MKANKASQFGRRVTAALLFSTAAPFLAMPTLAQMTTAPPPIATNVIKSVAVTGAQRLEPDTVRSYVQLRPGSNYTTETLDQAIRTLFDTELFVDVQIRDNGGALTIEVRENPVINRILLEGNKRIKEDKINKEIKLAPRQIFTRSKVRADVARIIELYRRQGRFAARVEPKSVALDQNRVVVVCLYVVLRDPLKRLKLSKSRRKMSPPSAIFLSNRYGSVKPSSIDFEKLE